MAAVAAAASARESDRRVKPESWATPAAGRRNDEALTGSAFGDVARSEDSTEVFPCPQCPETFANKRARRSHVASHDRCVCEECQRRFLTRKNRDRPICCPQRGGGGGEGRRRGGGGSKVFYRERDRSRHDETQAIEGRRDSTQQAPLDEGLQDEVHTRIGEDH